MSTTSPPPTPTPKPQGKHDTAISLFAFFICAIVWVALSGSFDSLNRAGWVPHTRTVNLYMQGDWLEGENRTCLGVQTQVAKGKPAEITRLICPVEYLGDTSHNLPVRFWGRVSRPNAQHSDEPWGSRFRWNCTRNGDGFVCKAIN
jgi:hypothetical protein